jgi:hypothetical protein
MPRHGFSPLIRQIRSGTARPASRSYARLIGVDLLLYAAIWFAVALTGDSWWQLALTLPAALSPPGSISSAMAPGTVRSPAPGGWIAFWDSWSAIFWSAWIMAQAVERRVGLVGWLTRNQGRLFIPLLLLEEINLKVTSVHRLVLAGLPYSAWR